jgi:hypothetical protein
MEKKFEIGDMVFQIMEEIKESRIKSAATIMKTSGGSLSLEDYVMSLLGGRSFKDYAVIKTSDCKYFYVNTEYIGYVQKKLNPEEYLKAIDMTKLDKMMVPEESYMIRFELRKEPETENFMIYKLQYEKALGPKSIISISEGIMITDAKKLAGEILSDLKPASASSDIEWVEASKLFGTNAIPASTINNDL